MSGALQQLHAAAPTRPVLRWHGGKWKLAPWILGHFPAHRVYVEPFGGAASVLLRKPRSYAEVYNDLDAEAVTLFRVLRDPGAAARLTRLLALTPFARDELGASYEATDDPVEQARRLIVRSFMGFGSDSVNAARRAGFRANSNRSHTTPAIDWANYPDVLPVIADRLRGVIIESRDALAVMAAHDSTGTLHYVDPPYLPETRSARSKAAGGCISYRHELTEDDHRRLLDFVGTLAGFVVLSGYPDPLYDAALAGWMRVERQAHADGARARTEVLWINPACAAALDRAQGRLFA